MTLIEQAFQLAPRLRDAWCAVVETPHYNYLAPPIHPLLGMGRRRDLFDRTAVIEAARLAIHDAIDAIAVRQDFYVTGTIDLVPVTVPDDFSTRVPGLFLDYFFRRLCSADPDSDLGSVHPEALRRWRNLGRIYDHRPA